MAVPAIDLADMARQEEAIMRDLEQFAELFVRKLLLLLFAWLVKLTPVLSGRARNGWDASLNQPSKYEPPNDGPFPVPPPPLSEAERFRLGMVAWIVNNVNYIGVLDQGSSAKAPAGMTPVAFANLKATYGAGS